MRPDLNIFESFWSCIDHNFITDSHFCSIQREFIVKIVIFFILSKNKFAPLTNGEIDCTLTEKIGVSITMKNKENCISKMMKPKTLKKNKNKRYQILQTWCSITGMAIISSFCEMNQVYPIVDCIWFCYENFHFHIKCFIKCEALVNGIRPDWHYLITDNRYWLRASF